MYIKLAGLLIAALFVFTVFAIGMQSLFGTPGIIVSAVLELGAALVMADRILTRRKTS